VIAVVVKPTCPKRRPWIHKRCQGGRGPSLFGNASILENFSDRVLIVMHRLARSLVTAAGCSKTTSAATRLAANWQRSAAARSSLLPWSTSRRTIHVRVRLPYNVEDGMGDFLSPAGLKVIAEDYQQGLLDRLNEQIKGNASVSYIYTNRVFTGCGLAWIGTNLENMSVAQIVISTAPHESQTLAFNYASLALNNSFFLHHLVSLCPLPVPPSSSIIKCIHYNTHNCACMGGSRNRQQRNYRTTKRR
jgi:hypothetical protein